MTRARPALRLLGAAGALCGSLAFVSLTESGVVRAAAESMTLIHQDLALAADTPLSITFLPPVPIGPTDAIIVGAYRRIDSRAQLTDTIEGEYGRVVDSVRVDPADPAAFAVGVDGQITITIPSESATGTPAALQFPRSGLYPVTVDVQSASGNLVSELLTFVDRLPLATDEDKGHLEIGVVATITAPPQIPGTDTELPAAVIDQINELAQYPDTVPLTVSISPEILGRLDVETMASLQPVLARSVVLAQPDVPLDPSAAAAAGQDELFTQYLQAGEDMIAAGAGVRPDRAAWIAIDPLTTEGAALLRSRGVGLILLPPETYAEAGIDGGYLGDFTLYSQLRDTQLPDGSSISTALFDPTINRNLTNTAMSPELSALYTAADLVAWRDQLYDTLPPVTGNSVALGLPEGGVLDRERVARLVDMVAATGAGQFTDLTEFAQITNVQIVDGSEAELTLAPQETIDLTQRAPTLADLSAQQVTVTSMLVEDGGRTDRWVRTIQVLASSSITDGEVDATAQTLGEEFDTITSAVVAPSSYTFTMNGFSANLYPGITNTSNEALNVVVRVSASADKMHFPAGDVSVVLAPNSVTTVTIPVRARSNGSFTVILEVLSPDGSTAITEPTILKAQVTTLTGLAQVFTGGALLILLTWWVRNLRRNRRRKETAASVATHPARALTSRPAITLTSEITTSTATATTGTSTITAVTAITQLETTGGTTTGTAMGSGDIAGNAAGDISHSSPGGGGPGSTTLSDS